MTGKHYVTPEEFDSMNADGKIFTYAIEGILNDCETNKTIIDSIRDINKLDIRFVYTCKCKDNRIQWFFGYSSEGIRNIVKNNIKLSIIEYRMKNNQNYKNIGSEPNAKYISNSNACSCPFDL